MKMETATKKRIQDTEGQTQDFRIQASGKAFEILSNGLYNNKERAILRELLCNANDAHIEAGKKDVPYEVHLPTHISPKLTVKDYGFGLSEENVYELYTTYFSSNKTNSNLFTGALGLGSKSPFALTDQFTVKSRFDGEEKTYLCYIGDQNIPQVQKLAEYTTNESSGMTVEMPVDERSINKMQKEFSIVVRPFDRKPLVYNYEYANIYIAKELVKTQGKGWLWIEEHPYTTSGDISAVQGNVEYPLQLNDIIDNEDTIGFFYGSVRGGEKILIYFPLGTLDVAANREELSLTYKTKENIRKRVEKVKEEVVTSIQKDVKKKQNLIELADYYQSFGHRVKKEVVKCEWKDGISVRDALSTTIPNRLSGQMIRYTLKGSRWNKNIRTSRDIYYEGDCFPLNSDAKFFYYDYTRGVSKGINKIKNGIRKGDFDTAILVYNTDIFPLFGGGIDYINLSEYEDPMPNNNSKKNRSTTPEFRPFVKNRTVEYKTLWRSPDKYADTFYNMVNHVNKPVICVVSTGRYTSELFGRKEKDEDFRDLISNIIRELPGYFNKKYFPIVYKVRRKEANTDEFKTNPNIVMLEDVIKELVKIRKGEIYKQHIVTIVNDYMERNNICPNEVFRFLENNPQIMANKLSKNSPFYNNFYMHMEIKKKLSRMNKRRDATKTIKNLGTKYGLITPDVFEKFNKVITQSKFSQNIKKIKQQYPLMEHLRNMGFRVSTEVYVERVLDYISMVDTCGN